MSPFLSLAVRRSTQRGRRDRVRRGRRLFPLTNQLCRLHKLFLRHQLFELSFPDHGSAQLQLGAEGEPHVCLGVIPRDAESACVHLAQAVLGHYMRLLRGMPVPDHRMFRIRFQSVGTERIVGGQRS